MNRYESYKQVNLPWLKEIPSHWEVKRLKRIFYISKDISYKENPVVLSLARDKIKIRDVESNTGQLAENYSNYNTVKIGDLLINPMDLYSGANCNISYYDGVISPAYTNLRTNQDISLRYFDFLFKIQYTSLAFQSVGKGVSKENRWTLSNETLLNYKLIVPSKKEQTQIANYLDWKINEIDKLIAKEKEKIRELELLSEIRINSILRRYSTEKIKLKYLVDMNLETLNIDDEELYIDYIEISDVGRGYLKNIPIRIKIKDAPSRARRVVRKYNILLSTVRTYLKSIYLIDDEDGYVASTGFAVLKAKKGIQSQYLFHVLSNDFFLNEVVKESTGISYPAINTEKLNNIFVYATSDGNLQNKIIKCCKKIDYEINCLINKTNEQIQNLESLKQSLIAEVVTGGIDVRDVVIPDYEKINLEIRENLEEEAD